MSLVRHSVLNIVGSVLPMTVAVPAMAYLARALGPEIFGLVTLAWAVTGYSAVLDLGMSRSVVRAIASNDGSGEDRHAVILSSAAISVFLLGVLGAAILTVALLNLHPGAFGVSSRLMHDVMSGGVALALGIPLLLVAGVIQAYWDGVEDFLEGNIQKLVASVGVPVFTVLAVLFQPSFLAAMCGVLVARVASVGFSVVRRGMWRMMKPDKLRRSALVELFSYGGWLAIANVTAPVLAYFERYALAGQAGVVAAGRYSPAAEIAMRLLVIPVAITRGLFPKLVAADEPAAMLIGRAHLLVTLVAVPTALVFSVFAKTILFWWLGAEYAVTAARSLQILMIGFLFGSFAQIPYTHLLAKGRSGVALALQIFEAVPYVWLTVILINRKGIEGAAWAWTARCAVDAILLYAINSRCGIRK